MFIVECINVVLFSVLCVVGTVTDIKYGVIKNKLLAIFAVLAVILDIVYYGFFARELFFAFIFNLALIAYFCL